MARCEVCGNDYDKAFEVTRSRNLGRTHSGVARSRCLRGRDSFPISYFRRPGPVAAHPFWSV